MWSVIRQLIYVAGPVWILCTTVIMITKGISNNWISKTSKKKCLGWGGKMGKVPPLKNYKMQYRVQDILHYDITIFMVS